MDNCYSRTHTCGILLIAHEVCGYSSEWNSYFQRYMARLVVKIGHQNDTCYDEMELCAQSMDMFRFGSLVKRNGRASVCDHSNEKENL